MSAQPAVCELIDAVEGGQRVSGYSLYADPGLREKLAGMLFHAEMDRRSLSGSDYPLVRTVALIVTAAFGGMVLGGPLLAVLAGGVAAWGALWANGFALFNTVDSIEALALEAATAISAVVPNLYDEDVAAICTSVRQVGLETYAAAIDPHRN